MQFQSFIVKAMTKSLNIYKQEQQEQYVLQKHLWIHSLGDPIHQSTILHFRDFQPRGLP